VDLLATGYCEIQVSRWVLKSIRQIHKDQIQEKLWNIVVWILVRPRKI